MRTTAAWQDLLRTGALHSDMPILYVAVCYFPLFTELSFVFTCKNLNAALLFSALH